MRFLPIAAAVLAGLSFAAGPRVLSAGELPATCTAEPPVCPWEERFEEKKARIAEGDVDLLFVGDSITHNWDDFGVPMRDYYYGGRKMANMGFGGDKTQHILWRLENAPMNAICPKAAVVMGGINNLMDLEDPENTPENVALGIKAIVNKLEELYPDIKILVLYTFPAAASPGHVFRARVAETNARLLDLLQDDPQVRLKDINYLWFDENSVIPQNIMFDELHPNAYGYWLWGQTVEPEIANMLGDTPKPVPAAPQR